jgi:hypothetical protein
VQDNFEVDYASKVQSTPEKKRVTWKPMLEEFHSSVIDHASNGDEEPHLVRCNLIKKCHSFLDPSEKEDVCLESLQDHSAKVWHPSEDYEKSISSKRPDGMPFENEQAVVASASSSALPPFMESSMQETILRGGLSEEEKHAGMKRRYSMLQQSFKMPVEEERRLRRERLRNLVPVWSKKRTEVQLLDGCKN